MNKSLESAFWTFPRLATYNGIASSLITISPWANGEFAEAKQHADRVETGGEEDIKRDIISMERKINRDSINSRVA